MAVYFRHFQDSIAVVLPTTEIKIATIEPEVKWR